MEKNTSEQFIIAHNGEIPGWSNSWSGCSSDKKLSDAKSGLDEATDLDINCDRTQSFKLIMFSAQKDKSFHYIIQPAHCSIKS